jgi:hypothetical protein
MKVQMLAFEGLINCVEIRRTFYYRSFGTANLKNVASNSLYSSLHTNFCTELPRLRYRYDIYNLLTPTPYHDFPFFSSQPSIFILAYTYQTAVLRNLS